MGCVGQARALRSANPLMAPAPSSSPGRCPTCAAASLPAWPSSSAPHVVEAVLNHVSGHKAGVARTWSALHDERGGPFLLVGRKVVDASVNPAAGFALAGLAVNG